MTTITTNDVPTRSTTDEEIAQFRATLLKLGDSIYMAPSELDALEPVELGYLLIRSMQHRGNSRLAAHVQIVCAGLRGLIAQVPEFQPTATA